MNKEQTIPINLWLAGRDYRIRINSKDEEAIRMAMKIATDRLQELRQSLDGKDEQDFLAMCLIMYATDQVTGGKTVDPVFYSGIQKMEEDIDKALNS